MPDRGPWGGGRRPPWWPEDQAWPPRGPHGWGAIRRRFVVRFALFLFVFLVIVIAGSVLAYHGFAGPRGRPPWRVGVTLLVLLGVLVFVRGVRRFAAPLGDVMEAADRVAEGDYAVRVEQRGPGEVRRLGRSFNRMAERLETNERRRRDLLADVAHELRTPLAVIQANVEGLLDGLYPADRAHLTPILDETKVLSRLLDDLQTLSTAEAGALRLRREPVAPAELVDDAGASFRAAAAEAGVSLETRAPRDLPDVSVDRLRIAEVFTNLLSNALRHTPAGGSIVVEAALDAPRTVGFRVRDTGVGIPAELVPHVFDRFAKASDSYGVGLGLAIAKGLVEAHGGTIAVEASAAGGTTVRFTIG